MAKARLTIVVEYNMNPTDYDGETDPNKMLQTDKQNFDDGNVDLYEFLDDVVDTTWEVIG